MRTAFKKTRSSGGGFTLLELLLASAIMSIGILGMVASFRYFNVGIQSAKGRSLANNLAQERVEYLKNRSYYRVLVTTATASDDNFSPALTYDQAPNGEEDLTVGGINFKRRVHIRKVSENPATGQLEHKSWNDPDTGLKEISVFVTWFEGGTWKKTELRNLLENPDRVNLSASFAGNIKDAASSVNISSAVVRAQENPSRYDYTDDDGNYYFDIEPGTYTLMASREGYFLKTRPTEVIAEGDSLAARDFLLTRMSSGTITGTVYKRDHMVVYMVVGSTVMVNGDDIEFVSLYNPTTAAMDVAAAAGNNIKLAYHGESGLGRDVNEFALNYISTYVPAGHYFLIASSGSFTYKGHAVTADAVYAPSNSPPCSSVGSLMNCIRTGEAGSVRIRDSSGGVIDTLGWNNSSTGKLPQYYEGTYKTAANGIEVNGQFFRYTAPGSGSEGAGSCYDTDVNSSNFFYFSSAIFRTMSTASGYKAPVTGTPAAGAVVFAEDGLSSAVTANSAGYFNLKSVATGYWTVYASSGPLMISTGPVGGASASFSHSVGNLVLSSDTLYGYVTGRVTDVNGVPMPNVRMYAGGALGYTGADGRYTITAPEGSANVVANYQTHDPAYIEYSSMGVVIAAGGVADPPVDFTLMQGGRLTGWVTTNGVDPLPNVPVIALKNGVEQGNTVTGSDGYFTVWGAGISTGTYEVIPKLEAGEASSPSTHTITLSAGETLFVGTFTVTGAMGYIEGSVAAGAAPITTGVLIYATTGTITSTPPTLDSSLRSGVVAYYAVSSDAAGSYRLAVRGGYSYNVYAWYTAWSGETPSTSRLDHSGVAVTPGGTVTRDFSW
ncbi:MAG: hypothetical protein RDU13_02110 [Elusimicrobiales bacterium]|nr:hypothetical protein [Elusimicrobiales bacterium]